MTTGGLATLLDTTKSQRLPTVGDRKAAERRARPTPPDGGDWIGEAQRYLRSVRRHKWLVLSLTLFATAAGVELSMYALPPNYAARATVWIQVPARQARDDSIRASAFRHDRRGSGVQRTSRLLRARPGPE